MNRRGAETQSGEKENSSSAPLRLCGEKNWLLWQLADSAFPTGGFAHSGGLEAAYQHRAVRGGTELAEYLRTALSQLAHNALPFVHAAFSGEPAFAEVDQHCDALLSNHVANRASRLQGQAMLATCERTFPREALRQFRDQVLDSELPTHGAPIFGKIAAILTLDAASTARLFVFTQLRGWISAAVRLNIVGPIEGQRVQHELAPDCERCAAQFGCVSLDEVCQTAPLLDLWQGTQGRLYSRLFQT
jgi:urease accessory protein